MFRSPSNVNQGKLKWQSAPLHLDLKPSSGGPKVPGSPRDAEVPEEDKASAADELLPHHPRKDFEGARAVGSDSAILSAP